VRLHGTSLAGRTLTMRKRLTIAQINAGATIVPALPGLKVRMTSALAIAVGGAVTTGHHGRHPRHAGGGSVKLVAFTQASLTQSDGSRAGGAGGTVLADGASFNAERREHAIRSARPARTSRSRRRRSSR
jgi:hypothetical protein